MLNELKLVLAASPELGLNLRDAFYGSIAESDNFFWRPNSHLA
jgi:hypothetical protein